MNVFVIGLGLIGGSFAIDIKAAFNEAVLYGVDASQENLDTALALELIDIKSEINELEKADVVIVAIPVDATVKVLPEVLDKIHDIAWFLM